MSVHILGDVHLECLDGPGQLVIVGDAVGGRRIRDVYQVQNTWGPGHAEHLHTRPCGPGLPRGHLELGPH
eukprot:5127809-Lingulodinium_polyedra.AAC.1